MLKINLIPFERRRKERTPLPRFFGIIVAVVICLGVLGWDVKTMMDTKKVKEDIAGKQAELAKVEAILNQIPALEQKINALKTWKESAEKITKSRVFKWWHAVDTLFDVLHEDENQTIWISSFECSDKSIGGSKVKKAIEAMIKMNCQAVSHDEIKSPITVMTDFRRRLKTNPELIDIFNSGINQELSFKLNATDAKEEWIVDFLIELYRSPVTGTK
jgi:cell division protein FtsB